MTKAELVSAMTKGVEAIEIFRGAVTKELFDAIEDRIHKIQGDTGIKAAVAGLFGMQLDKISSLLTSILQIIALAREIFDSEVDLRVKETLERLLNSPVKLAVIAGVL